MLKVIHNSIAKKWIKLKHVGHAAESSNQTIGRRSAGVSVGFAVVECDG